MTTFLTEHEFARRTLLSGAVGCGVAFGGFSRLFADSEAAQAAKAQKRVILVFMSGGPSQFETWDPKPGQSTGGPHLAIPTAVSGIHIDEYMPLLARHAGRMAVLRSMTSENGDHTEGAYIAQTGYKPTPLNPPMPHWLSVCSHELPLANELPVYVGIGREGAALAVPGAGFLGPRYQGLVCPGNGRPPEDLPAGISSEELAAAERREALRSGLGANFRQGRDPRLIEASQDASRRMVRLLSQSTLFDVSQEPAANFDRYGRSPLGRDLILARRLVERGVPFVRVQHQNGLAWDKHRRAFESQRNITAEFDTAVGALIDDLVDRGLWDHTLLVLMGEFGRTPEILGQGPPGRNHWTKCWSLSFGGCGVKGGVVVGATNDDGTAVKDRPVTIPDLFATFYAVLGIEPQKEIDFQGRPVPLVETKSARPIEEVL